MTFPLILIGDIFHSWPIYHITSSPLLLPCQLEPSYFNREDGGSYSFEAFMSPTNTTSCQAQNITMFPANAT